MYLRRFQKLSQLLDPRDISSVVRTWNVQRATCRIVSFQYSYIGQAICDEPKYKILRSTLKNKITQNVSDAKTTPSPPSPRSSSSNRTSSTAARALHLGASNAIDPNTLSTNSKGKHGTKNECTQYKGVIGVPFCQVKNRPEYLLPQFRYESIAHVLNIW